MATKSSLLSNSLFLLPLLNPYVLSADPCGSISGSTISVAANMAAVSLGTDTDGSILCPSSNSSVVGIKPTILNKLDGNRPICRTVADVVYVLDAIGGFDCNDEATREASKYIPLGVYKQFLKPCGFNKKRMGIVRNHPFFELPYTDCKKAPTEHKDNLKKANIDDIMNSTASGEFLANAAEFKLSLNVYLEGLVSSPVRSLVDVIAFNNKFSKLTTEYGQFLFETAQTTEGIDSDVIHSFLNLEKLSRDGFEKLMRENKQDAVVTPGYEFATVLAIGGYLGISVPAGYDIKGVPFAFASED
ncbi:hypothetical protein Dsin_026268 [Dipteronia sinensis]|uniref:Amidase domain-containing protein n=1 Tax=Dipteronia sinensis TaxID=43782 RepID=A0AAE0DXV5_9ROSI|nr:hypothetical protein Dsin_026268 [Dipteronia sinensis]